MQVLKPQEPLSAEVDNFSFKFIKVFFWHNIITHLYSSLKLFTLGLVQLIYGHGNCVYFQISRSITRISLFFGIPCWFSYWSYLFFATDLPHSMASFSLRRLNKSIILYRCIFRYEIHISGFQILQGEVSCNVLSRGRTLLQKYI